MFCMVRDAKRDGKEMAALELQLVLSVWRGFT